jgi:hypothetical protein
LTALSTSSSSSQSLASRLAGNRADKLTDTSFGMRWLGDSYEAVRIQFGRLCKSGLAVLLPGRRKVGDEPLAEPPTSADRSAMTIAGFSGLPHAAVDVSGRRLRTYFLSFHSLLFLLLISVGVGAVFPSKSPKKGRCALLRGRWTSCTSSKLSKLSSGQ